MEQIKIIRSFGILNRTYLQYISGSLSIKDISYSDSIFLVNIGNRPGVSQEELANSLAINKSAIARSVKNLEKKAYLKIERSPVDKRVKRLHLTDSGKKLFRFMENLNDQWIKHVMGTIRKKDFEHFIETIEEMSIRAKIFNRNS